MIIDVYVKSGTGGYSDYDGVDRSIIQIENDTFPIPRIGESIEVLEKNDKGLTDGSGNVCKEYHQYLVTDVRYWIVDSNKNGVSIYVVPIGRTIS